MVCEKKVVHLIRTYLLFAEGGSLCICNGLSAGINYISVSLMNQIKSFLIIDVIRKTKQSIKCMKRETRIL